MILSCSSETFLQLNYNLIQETKKLGHNSGKFFTAHTKHALLWDSVHSKIPYFIQEEEILTVKIMVLIKISKLLYKFHKFLI